MEGDDEGSGFFVGGRLTPPFRVRGQVDSDWRVRWASIATFVWLNANLMNIQEFAYVLSAKRNLTLMMDLRWKRLGM